MSNPKVFISYSHDSPEHRRWVLKLASDLRAVGIDATLDQWDLALGQDLAAFMHDGIASSDRVLLIWTEPYVQKSEGGLGGVGYERLIVTAEVTAAIDTKKFIPIVRQKSSPPKTQTHLGVRRWIDFSDDAGYGAALEELCRELLGVPALAKPPLGSNPFSAVVPTEPLPERSVSGTGSLISGGKALLSTEWFARESNIAGAGIRKMGLAAGMELRFALHTPVNKSQIDLLTAVRSSEIHTFGWPIGVTLENRPEYRPRPLGDGIRAEVAIPADGLSGRESYDYWALARSGDFFLLQSLFEDMRDKTKIYFNTRIVRVAEALLFANGLYTHLGAPPETRLSVRVAHFGLAGRALDSSGGRRVVQPVQCVEDRCESEIVVPVGAIKESIVADVQRLTAPMFMLFEFTEFGDRIYQDIVEKFMNGTVT